MDDVRHTPTIGGYALAVLVSVLAASSLVVGAALCFLVTMGAGAEDLVGLAFTWSIFVLVGLVVATPLACVAVPVIHLLCREQPSQTVHVVVTGVVSFALVVGVFFFAADGGGGGDALVTVIVAGVVGVATMIGRASVIPLVRRPKRHPARFERSNSQIRV